MIDKLLPEWLKSNGIACQLGPFPSSNTVTLGLDGETFIITSWGEQCGPQPTIAAIAAFEESPEWLAHVRGQRAAQLVTARQAALTARMGQTWPGLSAGEVAISIAAQEPSAEVVADYLADRQTILAAHETAVAALATMTLEQLEAAIAAGGA